jgi:hypothetical protein
MPNYNGPFDEDAPHPLEVLTDPSLPQEQEEQQQTESKMSPAQEKLVRDYINSQYDIQNKLSHELVDETTWKALMLMLQIQTCLSRR